MNPDAITEDVLIQIAELNCAFLQLLSRHIDHAKPMARVFGLHYDVAAKLRAASDDTVRLLAGCSYTLFDLRLGDATFWQAVRRNHVPETYSATAMPEEVRSDARYFTEAALLYAWHLARTRPLAAQLTMGMNQQIVDGFAAKSIISLCATAATAGGLLAATHADNRVFWPDLMRYALKGTKQQFDAAVRLGSQLIAANLAER